MDYSMTDTEIKQHKKLQSLLAYLAKYSPFYRELFDRHKINIEAIKSVADLQSIPTTTKEHLHERNNDFVCVSRNRIIEYTSTSGTLGAPVTVALT